MVLVVYNFSSFKKYISKAFNNLKNTPSVCNANFYLIFLKHASSSFL